jgi:tripartite-type tricarboxylate transporter receptor subunit TctC
MLQVLTRRSILAAGVLAPIPAWARAWPSGTIRIINPFPAGGASDSIVRLLQPGLQQRLGATIVVENKPGASASVGATVVAKSPPDGSTWLLTSDTFVVASLLLNNLPYDVRKDFEPVTMVARGPMVLCTSPARPYRTLADVVAAAKARPNTLTYATTGIGSNGHLTVAALCQLTDMRLVHVPYRGVAPATNDAVAGHVDMIVSSTASLAPQIEAGQLHAVVQCGDKRAAFLPDAPTAIESGIANFHTYSWFGFFGPAGTPKPIIDRFHRDVVATARDEAITSTLVNKYRVEVPLPTPAELGAMIVEELPFWAGIIRDNNIKGGA